MTIYKSRQVSLDKEPWVSVNHGGRGATALVYDDMKYDPRPEFEPTRDPKPYVVRGHRYPEGTLPYEALFGGATVTWAPRREQFDTPVNRVLAAFRTVGDANAEAWAYCLGLAYSGESWPVVDHWDALEDAVESIGPNGLDEIDHARRVLLRLSTWDSVKYD